MFIDPAPRGFVCLSVAEKLPSSTGAQQTDTHHQACSREILISRRGPTEDWVLAHHEDAQDGALPGRAVTDLVVPGPCMACRGKVLDANNWVDMDQYSNSDKTRSVEDSRHVKPVRYEYPFWDKNGPLDKHHSTLRKGAYYHYWDLREGFGAGRGVPDEHIVKEPPFGDGVTRKATTMNKWLRTNNIKEFNEDNVQDVQDVEENRRDELNPFV